VENANAALANADLLNNQGGDSNACFVGARFGACMVIKNVAEQWNAAGQLVPFGLEWVDRQLRIPPTSNSTSGYAHGAVGAPDRAEPINPPPMGVGIMRIESAGAGAIGGFGFKPVGDIDPALAGSGINTWLHVPLVGTDFTGCDLSGYMGCFVADVFGGAYVSQPNSYTGGKESKDFPCNTGLCQALSGLVGNPHDYHPQVNFTALTAPLTVTVTNNSSSPLTFAGQLTANNMVLSDKAPNPAPGATVQPKETVTFYGYRSMTQAGSDMVLSFTTPDGARINATTALASKQTNPMPTTGCDVQNGSNIGKRYSCDAFAPNAIIAATSGLSDSPNVNVTFSIRS